MHADCQVPVRLGIVVPVYGNWADTLECLGTLAAQTCRAFHVFVVDDGSPEAAPDAVRGFPFVTYLRRAHGGFAAACNAGVDAAADGDCTHVLLLNDDTAFATGFVAAWLETIAACPAAILGPMICHFDRPDTVWYSGGPRSIAVPFFRYRRRYTTQTPVDVLTGCVLLVPVEVWRQLDGFDERYVTYYEDFDFVLRARDAGVPVYLLVEPELRVLHKVSRTTLRDGRWPRDYRMIASRLVFIRRRYAGFARALCLVATIPHLVTTVITNLPALPDPRRLGSAIRTGLTADAAPRRRRGAASSARP